jgi:hypothetical protein
MLHSDLRSGHSSTSFPAFPAIRAECHVTEPSIRRSDRPTALPAERADDGLTSEGRSQDERRGAWRKVDLGRTPLQGIHRSDSSAGAQR